WAHLLRHVFLVDVTVCPDCGGRMKWLEFATETRDILRILAELGIAPRGPPPVAHNHPAAWSAPRQLRLPFWGLRAGPWASSFRRSRGRGALAVCTGRWLLTLQDGLSCLGTFSLRSGNNSSGLAAKHRPSTS